MPSTWVVGDIHGCAEELHALLERIELGPQDRCISVGDLYHRGPDPYGVCQLLAARPNVSLVLGNHERALLRRAGLAGRRADGSDAPPIPSELSRLDRRGDGHAPLAQVTDDQFRRMLQLLERRPYFLEGPGWLVLHAGLLPGRKPSETPPDALVRTHRIAALPGKPLWHDVYAGPDLALYGHVPHRQPRPHRRAGRLVALGLDTGCVHGGSLTAFRVETRELVQVPAGRAYAAR
ncbi:MAG: serine/threonine protein phosphatase [Planctomycetota bacterium]|nr:MAG: serine/threonine protein phosphatase [Planctomycetota bacterium]